MILVGKTVIVPGVTTDRLAALTANIHELCRGSNQAHRTDFLSLLRFGKAAPFLAKNVHLTIEQGRI